jgi:hypothetical protein
MQTTQWDPAEAGKQSRDHKLSQQRLESSRTRSFDANRKKRSDSVIRPAMFPIKRETQTLVAVFNNQLKNTSSADKATVYEDLGGMGLHGIPSAFEVKFDSASVKLIPDYDNWQILIQCTTGVSKTYDVDDEFAEGVRQTFYKDGENRVTAEEIARFACSLVCE